MRGGGGVLSCCITAGIDGSNHFFRRLVAGGGHDDGAREFFVQLLKFRGGLIQTVFYDLRIKARGGYEVYALRKGHVAHYGKPPACGQGRSIVQIGYSAAALADTGCPALSRRGLSLG